MASAYAGVPAFSSASIDFDNVWCSSRIYENDALANTNHELSTLQLIPNVNWLQTCFKLRLKAMRNVVVSAAFQLHLIDHLTTTQEGRRGAQQFSFAPQEANARWATHLMTWNSSISGQLMSLFLGKKNISEIWRSKFQIISNEFLPRGY